MLHHQWLIIYGPSSIALYHRWGIINGASLQCPHHWWNFIINGPLSSMAHHLWHLIMDSSSSMALIIDGASSSMSIISIGISTLMEAPDWWLTIAALASLLCRLQILVGLEFGQSILTVVHTVRELQLWNKGIEWSHSSTMSNYNCVDIPMYISIKSNAAAATTELNKPRGPLIKMMSLATIIFRWHSQNYYLCPCFWRSKICEKFGQSKTKILLQNY